ncbi:MAG: hypothetical protein ACT4OF_12540 [Caulobacteraceae bacterium]
MARRRHRLLWEDQASISADYLQTSWRLFDPAERRDWNGSQTAIQPDGWDIQGITQTEALYDSERQTLTLVYSGHDGDPEKPALRTTVLKLQRQACQYGGHRFLFVAPCCAKRVRKLALLPRGIACGQCGSLTYRSKRKSGVQRIIHKADVLAGRLDCASWYAPPTERPKGMRRETFNRLAEEHARLVQKAMAIVRPRIARAAARGVAAHLAAMMRAGM